MNGTERIPRVGWILPLFVIAVLLAFVGAQPVVASDETDSSVTVLTANDIKTHGYRTLADVLRTVPGFYATDDRNYGYVGVRGVLRPADFGSRIQLNVNGHRYNDNVYGAASYGDDFPIDMEWIHRIEIHHGPGLISYGNNAALAVVDVYTEAGQSLPGVQAQAQVGESGYKNVALSASRQFPEGTDALVTARFFTTDGQNYFFSEFDDPTSNDGMAVGADGEEGYSTYLDVRHKNFWLFGTVNEREKHNPTGAWGTLYNDPRHRTVDSRNFAVARWERPGENATRVEASYNQVRYDGDFPYAVDDSTEALNRDEGRGEWIGVSATQQLDLHPSHRIEVGGATEWTIRTTLRNWDVGESVLWVDRDQKVNASGLWAQDRISVGPGSVSIGGRLDHVSDVGHHISPRISAAWPLPNRSVIRAQYRESYRAPNVYELGFDDGAPNPDLKGEVNRMTEATLSVPVGRLMASWTAYDTRMEDMILLVLRSDDVLQFQNRTEVKSQGMEWDVRGRVGRRVDAFASFALQETKDEATGQRLTNSPEQIYQVGMAVTTPGSVIVSARVRGMSARKTLANHEIPAYAVTSLGLTVPRSVGGANVSLTLDNVFDADFSDPGGFEHVQDTIPQEGRSIRLKAGYGF